MHSDMWMGAVPLSGVKLFYFEEGVVLAASIRRMGLVGRGDIGICRNF